MFTGDEHRPGMGNAITAVYGVIAPPGTIRTQGEWIQAFHGIVDGIKRLFARRPFGKRTSGPRR